MATCVPCSPSNDIIKIIKDGDVRAMEDYLSTLENEESKLGVLSRIIKSADDHVRASLAKVVLETIADVNKVDAYMGMYPILLTAKYGRLDVLGMLLDRKVDVWKCTGNNETVLHCLLRGHIDNHISDEETIVEFLKKLPLSNNKDKLNVCDTCGGFTVTHLAANRKLWDVLRLLLTYNSNVDIIVENVTTRDLIKSMLSGVCEEWATELLQLLESVPVQQQQKDLLNLLFDALNNKNQDDFLKIIKNNDVEKFRLIMDSTSVANTTLLLTAAKHGMDAAARKLVEEGANVNTVASDGESAAMMAACYGYSAVLEAILKSQSCDLSLKSEPLESTALHLAVTCSEVSVPCVELLLQYKDTCKLNINAQDFRERTALHYAAKRRNTAVVKLLLKHGANIFVQDDDQLPALFDINAQLLKDFLDDAISSEKALTDEDHCLVMNYSFLVPPDAETPCKAGQTSEYSPVPNPSTTPCKAEQTSVNMPPAPRVVVKPETQPLVLLASSPDHRHLLNHPLIRSFLQLKWYRIIWFFYLNLGMYALFTISLSFYIYNVVTPVRDEDNSTVLTANNETSSVDVNKSTVQADFWWYSVFFMLIYLTLREIMQFAVSCCHYWTVLENLMEVALIILTCIILFVETDKHSLQSMLAVVVLLAYTEQVLLIGRHPSLAKYITMFLRVSKSFLYFLLWYSPLIVGFGYTFHIIFRNCNEDCEKNFFVHLRSSLFKTTIMLTGEFEAGELVFSSVISQVLFLFFIFFIAIVLLSLLNGLAVSDIQAIKDEAQVVCCVAQVKLYSNIESVLLRQDSWLRCCLKNWLANKILLLSRFSSNGTDGKNYLLRIKLNKGNSLEPDIRSCYQHCCSDLRKNVCSKNSCIEKICKWCIGFNMIVRDARAIVAERGHITEGQQILGQMKEFLSLIKLLVEQKNKQTNEPCKETMHVTT